jgi:uncharacterized membrane protein
MSLSAFPKHFPNVLDFDEYVLRCAIRDREAFLDGLERLPDYAGIAKETRAEIEAMHRRVASVRRKRIRKEKVTQA